MIKQLTQQKCRPCEGIGDVLSAQKIEEYRAQISSKWEVVDRKKTNDGKNKLLRREFVFKNFVRAMAFLNGVADIAEQEGHHPDFRLHNYKKITLETTTHAILGLSRNDFILAAKIDYLLHEKGAK